MIVMAKTVNISGVVTMALILPMKDVSINNDRTQKIIDKKKNANKTLSHLGASVFVCSILLMNRHKNEPENQLKKKRERLSQTGELGQNWCSNPSNDAIVKVRPLHESMNSNRKFEIIHATIRFSEL
jgi:hypothetical protein